MLKGKVKIKMDPSVRWDDERGILD